MIARWGAQSGARPPSRDVPDRTVGDALRDAAARWPERVALMDGSPALAERRVFRG